MSTPVSRRSTERIDPADALAPGKFRRMNRLADKEGRFAILAIDQRDSLQKMIAPVRGVAPADVTGQDMSRVKRAITAAAAPLASAVLTDQFFGYPATLDVIPPDVGVLLPLEATGYEAVNQAERLSRLLEGWDADRICRAGADAVKLLLWHHPEASQETHRHQQEVVRSVGEACDAAGMPFVLELVTYNMDPRRLKASDFAKTKPDLILDAARTYSASSFKVDLFKLEFPGELKYTEEYQSRAFARGEVVNDLAAVEAGCRAVDAATSTPWTILSAGVDPEEFVEDVRLANAAGASGFLCGRAVWKKVVEHVDDDTKMRAYMESTGIRFFKMILEANEDALPWQRHRRFATASNEADALLRV